ncbi:hypothetical protein ILYODFUR_015012 [Ilyodon furcidens]|uniref:Uncharacterized protein n=1 Tax=Ilyodon furcidens TaxID=33524 RepID=A0ABV0V573_9TELE
MTKNAQKVSVSSLGHAVHAALGLPHLIAADVHSGLNTVRGSTTLQLSFRNHFSGVINASPVSSVPPQNAIMFLS